MGTLLNALTNSDKLRNPRVKLLTSSPLDLYTFLEVYQMDLAMPNTNTHPIRQDNQRDWVEMLVRKSCEIYFGDTQDFSYTVFGGLNLGNSKTHYSFIINIYHLGS